jgi:4a-hydroxytetrahydrobiopterin dehydratase
MIPLNTFKFQYVDNSKKIEKLEIFGSVRKWNPKESIENFLNYKACEIVIIIENSGWQTKAKGSYKGSESDEILQEYKFETNVEAGEFCKLATELFSSKGHHPDKFIWKDTRVLVSLTSHSAGGITDKDWEVASELDRIYTK